MGLYHEFPLNAAVNHDLVEGVVEVIGTLWWIKAKVRRFWINRGRAYLAHVYF